MSENSNRVTDTSEPPPRRRFLNQAAAAGLAGSLIGGANFSGGGNMCGRSLERSEI